MKFKLFFLLFLICSGAFAQKQNNVVNTPDVLWYDINLNITDFDNRTISGNTQITFVPRQKADIFYFDFEGLTVDSVTVPEPNMFSYSQKATKIVLISKNQISTSDTIVSTVYYSGKPIKDDAWGGFFFQSGYAYNMGVGMASVPHSYGRVWYPCIDDFEEKARYNFNITVQKGHTAVCSGHFVSKAENSDSTLSYHWQATKEIPAYITSVAVGEYTRLEKMYHGITKNTPIDIYSKPELSEKIQASFVNLDTCLSIYENSYGPYVWDRIGYVTVPFKSGAMEHNCNIAYPEYAVDGTLEKETLMAHELSHHWFGNLVTCATAKDMWLNEGWASYSEALFKEHRYGKEAYKKYVRQNHEKVLKLTHLYDGGYRAVYGIPAENTYGSTVYDKGADAVHTLRSYMGDSLFFATLKTYLSENAYGSVSTKEFQQFFTEHSGLSLDNFFEDWIYKKGFSHFCVNNFKVTKAKEKFHTKVTIRQQLKARKSFADSVPVELSLFDENLNRFEQTVYVSGETETVVISTDFEPVTAFADLNEKLSDAAIDHYSYTANQQEFEFVEEGVDVKLLSDIDKGLIRARRHFVVPENIPDSLDFVFEGFWDISGVNIDRADGQLTFLLPNYELDGINLGEISLLYRKTQTEPWRTIEVAKEISGRQVVSFTTKFRDGEFVLID
ncbi:MAG: M1 family metallopeptidase [Bacteroidota bacterium]|nr:M1 family metallopeptidase [Bacteroidota bacterium]